MSSDIIKGVNNSGISQMPNNVPASESLHSDEAPGSLGSLEDVLKVSLPPHLFQKSPLLVRSRRGESPERMRSQWGERLTGQIIQYARDRRRMAEGVWDEIIRPLGEVMRRRRQGERAEASAMIDSLRPTARQMAKFLKESVGEQRLKVLRYYRDTEFSWRDRIARARLSASSMAGAETLQRALYLFGKGAELEEVFDGLSEGAAMAVMAGYRLSYYQWIREVGEKVIAPIHALVKSVNDATGDEDIEAAWNRLLEAWGDTEQGYLHDVLLRSRELTNDDWRYPPGMRERWAAQFEERIRNSGIFSRRVEERVQYATHEMRGWMGKLVFVLDSFLGQVFQRTIIERARSNPEFRKAAQHDGTVDTALDRFHYWFDYEDPLKLAYSYASPLDHIETMFPNATVVRSGDIPTDANADVFRMMITCILARGRAHDLSSGDRGLTVSANGAGVFIYPIAMETLAFLAPLMPSLHPNATIATWQTARGKPGIAISFNAIGELQVHKSLLRVYEDERGPAIGPDIAFEAQRFADAGGNLKPRTLSDLIGLRSAFRKHLQATNAYDFLDAFKYTPPLVFAEKRLGMDVSKASALPQGMDEHVMRVFLMNLTQAMVKLSVANDDDASITARAFHVSTTDDFVSISSTTSVISREHIECVRGMLEPFMNSLFPQSNMLPTLSIQSTLGIGSTFTIMFPKVIV